MLKQRLEIESFDNIICIGFSKNVAWSFSPIILENEIISFIEKKNLRRKTPLTCKNRITLKIEKQIKNLIS